MVGEGKTFDLTPALSSEERGKRITFPLALSALLHSQSFLQTAKRERVNPRRKGIAAEGS